MHISNLFIPIITILIITYGLLKRIDIYDSFINGIKEGLTTCLKIFPTIFAMMLAINIFLKSNIINDISNYISFVKYHELLPIILLRPVSGSASLIAMNDIMINCGVDSFLGRIAAVIQGSTDTTIYIISLYFSSVGIKKIKSALLVGLFSDLMCVIFAIISVKILF